MVLRSLALVVTPKTGVSGMYNGSAASRVSKEVKECAK